MAIPSKINLAILGGGPSALFIYKKLIESSEYGLTIDIFEKRDKLGPGMPYSADGANQEHITNVSGNEIPELLTPVSEWIQSVPKEILLQFHIDAGKFNDYKTLPRLLFGQYLSDQFTMLRQKAKTKGIDTQIFFNSTVTDIVDDPAQNRTEILVDGKSFGTYDRVVICTGHLWPLKNEGKIPGYFDSPYPPKKLQFSFNGAIAIRGSSLTAIDAIRTLARSNGSFTESTDGRLTFKSNDNSPAFRISMFSRNGLLPALRFHLEDSQLGKNAVLPDDEIDRIRRENDGFLPLDYVFEKNFKQGIQEHDPDFFNRIRDMTVESFVDWIMELREKIDPFQLLSAEFVEAEKSIKRKESIYWKEMLGVLSFAMNHPAKYFSAEDMLRLKRTLMPLISVVIAYVPQSSAAELLAMHRSGTLEIVAVGEESTFEPAQDEGVNIQYTDQKGCSQAIAYSIFIDCIGQPHLTYEEFPYPGLVHGKTVSRAKLYFRDPKQGEQELKTNKENVKTDQTGRYYLIVPGVTINDSFQAVDEYNALNDRIYIMAVPFISGFNPDYSGLDFGESTSSAIAKAILARSQA